MSTPLSSFAIGNSYFVGRILCILLSLTHEMTLDLLFWNLQVGFVGLFGDCGPSHVASKEHSFL